jgi:hypothetical protein
MVKEASGECEVLLEQAPTETYARLLMARTCERLGRKDEAATHRRLLAVMSGDDSLLGP